jgi:tetratricopeptide (TPR) repeat protein
MQALSLADRVATALLGTLAYLTKLVFPQRLAFFHPHPAIVTPESFAPFGSAVLLAALCLAALTAGAGLARRRAPELFVGWSWMLVMFAPVIGLVQVGSQFMADRYAYLPLLGPTLALVFFPARALPPRAARVGWVLGLGAAALLARVAHRQAATWRDSQTMSTHALAVTEHNAVAHEHLGLYLQRKQDLEGARQHYLAALAIDPRAVSTHGNLGAIYAQLGQREAAQAQFQTALRLVPDHLETRMSLGFMLELEGDLGGAVEQYTIAVREHPDEVEPLRPLAEALKRLGRSAEARTLFQRYAQARAPSAELECALGECAAELADPRAALTHFLAAERLEPLYPRALHGRAWVHATSAERTVRDGARALELLEACRGRDGAQWSHLRTLAAALAALGRTDEAATKLTEAWAGAPRTEWERLKAERDAYQSGRALER